MSKKTEICCDKCGRVITNKLPCYNPNYGIKTASAKILLWSVDEPRSTGGQRIDLCEVCYRNFVNWLESEVTE